LDTHKQVKAFTTEILRIRQLLQEGRRLTDSEHQILKASLEALLLDVDNNARKSAHPH
jgi:hypothetical protein